MFGLLTGCRSQHHSPPHHFSLHLFPTHPDSFLCLATAKGTRPTGSSFRCVGQVGVQRGDRTGENGRPAWHCPHPAFVWLCSCFGACRGLFHVLHRREFCLVAVHLTMP
jgi:hypothetical protein